MLHFTVRLQEVYKRTQNDADIVSVCPSANFNAENAWRVLIMTNPNIFSGEGTDTIASTPTRNSCETELILLKR